MRYLVKTGYILASLVLAAMLQGCPDKCEGPSYHVDVPVDIYPAKDTLNVGDTLWMETRFSDVVQSVGGGNEQYANGVFCAGAFMLEIIPSGTSAGATVEDATLHFKRLVKTGVEVSSSGITHCNVQAIYRNNEYQLKIGFVALKTGIFYLDNTFYPGYQQGEDRCKTQSTVNSHFTVSDNHVASIFSNYGIAYDDNPEGRQLKNSFAFVVVDNP